MDIQYWQNPDFNHAKIPRGKAQAPKIVVPKEDITTESLKATVRQTRESIQVLNTLHKNHYFVHPYFGKLNVQQTICFLHTHTKASSGYHSRYSEMKSDVYVKQRYLYLAVISFN